MSGKTFAWPESNYYEGHPEGFDVYSWSPSPPGTPLDLRRPLSRARKAKVRR